MAETLKMCGCARWYSKPQLRVGQDTAVAQEGGLNPHMSGASGLPRTCKGLFTHITHALSIDDTDPEERKVIQAVIFDLVVDPHALPECAQDISLGNLTGEAHGPRQLATQEENSTTTSSSGTTTTTATALRAVPRSLLRLRHTPEAPVS